MYETLLVAAQAGSLDSNMVRKLHESGILSDSERISLIDTNKAARKVQNAKIREQDRSAAFRDLRGVISRAGLPSELATVDDDDQVTFSHGGHRVTFPATQTKRLAPMFRAILSAFADASESEDSEPAPLSLVGNG